MSDAEFMLKFFVGVIVALFIFGMLSIVINLLLNEIKGE